MARRIKTVEYAWQSNSESLAENTQYTFVTSSIELPESSKVFQSARLLFGFRDQVTSSISVSTTVSASVNGIWQSASIGSTPTPSSVQYAPIELDVTQIFRTQFTGSIHNVQVSARMTRNTTNVTAKMYLTYEYEDTGSATLVKTVRLPLQTITGSLTTSSQEIRSGVYSTQIPALDTLLPETSKTYKDIWIETYYTDNLLTAMRNTQPSMVMQIGTGTTHSTGYSESTASVSCNSMYIWEQGTTPEWSTANSHSFNAYYIKNSTASLSSSVLYHHPAYILNVTYTYLTSSQRVMNSIVLPLPSITHLGGTTEADAVSRNLRWEIQEPGPITASHSGMLISWVDDNTVATNIKLGSASYMTYAGALSGTSRGSSFLSERIDLDGAWTASRGTNSVPMSVWYAGTPFGGATGYLGGFAYINYTSNVSQQGEGVHNRSVLYNLRNTSTAVNGAVTTTASINVPDTNWYLNGLGYVSYNNMNLPPASAFWLETEATGSEGRAGRWEYIGGPHGATISNSGISLVLVTENLIEFDTNRWERWANDWTPRLRLNTARRYRFNVHNNSGVPLSIWATTHGITYNVTGSIARSEGGTVSLGLHDSATGLLLATGSRVGNGTYTLLTYDNTRLVFVEAKESNVLLGRSNDGLALGTP
jgi:hypothetical protein